MTPEIIGLDSANKMVELQARTISSSYTGMIVYGVANSNGDASSFTILDTIYATGTWDKYTIYLDAASGVGTGDARFGFIQIQDGSTFDYWMIDDVKVKNIPPCPDPIAISLGLYCPITFPEISVNVISPKEKYLNSYPIASFSFNL